MSQGAGTRGWQSHPNILDANTIDHGGLLGLGDDDHPQYALLAGRLGGQTLAGGILTTGSLTLRPNSQASASTGQVIIDLTHGETEQVAINTHAALGLTDIQNVIIVNKGLSGLSGHGRIAGFTISGSYDVSIDPNAIPFLVFNFNPTVRLISTTADLNTYRIFSTSGTITVDGVATGRTGSVFTPYDWVTAFTSVNGGTATFESASALKVKPTFDAGWTQFNGSTVRGMEYDVNPTNVFAGTGVAVDIINNNFTTALTLRSAVANAEMRHAGPGVFGANAAPTNASAGLEVQSTTRALLISRMTTAQRDAMASVPGMLIYNTTTAQHEKCTVAGTGGTATYVAF